MKRFRVRLFRSYLASREMVIFADRRADARSLASLEALNWTPASDDLVPTRHWVEMPSAPKEGEEG